MIVRVNRLLLRQETILPPAAKPLAVIPQRDSQPHMVLFLDPQISEEPEAETTSNTVIFLVRSLDELDEVQINANFLGISHDHRDLMICYFFLEGRDLVKEKPQQFQAFLRGKGRWGIFDYETRELIAERQKLCLNIPVVEGRKLA